jgi:hypothetical protein
MGLKTSNPLDLYRAAAAPGPSAATDDFILAAARARREHANLMRPLLLVCAMGVAMLFALRWFDAGETSPQTTDFGIAEGQAAAWLATFDPYTPTGYGSQEGLP